ncbi:helix-turn-helix transcriptional regulator [Myxococcus sp. CA051A]|uniref:helix-turn-helix domain-containing protein n=1 Tax=unclassified Myxococcus TaxID=2648731 RepID=UPI00157A684B|nr:MULTISPECIES: helix-turn-helix transcriptional regulator [unclassified Myxococcus]NTX08878.1 helix-turn-helix transcriptional regulator [Myxococcus sp. CA040A]NTX17673.1 helix-turn-helix transcriptional regulator [Myxococcus sp. CA056]NTX40794.1 helix-turn-helix transcriptional regulator [Myxococcus sp. CA033]NTX56203.1 helix-turn-helix transcriptional regulator [Myxococcus sp. CA039A]NTX63490.1 helix-turn-helix transcriptional regulator [Myxococcus sp. CA051A]
MREPVDHKLAAILGGAARVARLRLGLTQSDVAERVGMAMEVYSRLERGRMLPRTQTLKRLCDVLQVSSDTLLGVGRGGASLTPVASRKPEREDPLELRRMTRKLRELEPSQLRAVSRVVNAVVAVMPPVAPAKPVRAVRRRKATG